MSFKKISVDFKVVSLFGCQGSLLPIGSRPDTGTILRGKMVLFRDSYMSLTHLFHLVNYYF